MADSFLCVYFMCDVKKWSKISCQVFVYKSQQKTRHRQIILNMRAAGKITQIATKNPIQKIENKYFQKRIARPQSQFPHSCVYERFIHIFSLLICLFCCRKYVDQSWEYINRSKTHECGNRDWGPPIPRKGIHKWDFHCCAHIIHENWVHSLPKEKKLDQEDKSSNLQYGPTRRGPANWKWKTLGARSFYML
jgi:hypothetical protein